MKLCDDFINRFSEDYRSIYFPNENHGYTENQNYQNSKKFTEIFASGYLGIKQFTYRLSKCCNTSYETIENLLSKYIIE